MIFQKKPYVIAEIGNTHIKNMDRAKNLANLAKLAGADAIKLQKRNPKECVPKKLWNQPHPNKRFAYGDTYLEHRVNLEFSLEEHDEFKQYCDKIGITYSTSVWDMTSAKEIVQLKPDFIKIPSAANHNENIIEYLASNYTGDIHISTGMTTHKERNEIFSSIGTFSRYSNRFIIYHCISGYPVPFEQIYLKEIKRIKQNWGGEVGFSNHGYGIALEPAAYVLGCRYFERHFIDDRTFPHTDASCSLEPDGLRRLCRDLKAVHKSYEYKPSKLERIEQEQRDKLRGN